MFDYMDYMVDHGHEQLVFNYDEETGLRALIAIHSTRLGPSLGGTRLWTYDSIDDAVRDVLRLSEGMTFKAAVAGLPLGGGKAVILADGQESDPVIREARFRAFGRFVDSLGGRYITAEDVGTRTDDMAAVHEFTDHVSGLPGGSEDPSPMTAYGVLQGIRAGVEHVFKSESLSGLHVAIQGLGKVGYALAEHLVREGATVTATDIDPVILDRARDELSVNIVEQDAIYSVDCDIFAPCALGAVINDTTLPQLTCKMIAGAANNQLEDVGRHSRLLAERGIVYLVDYVINSGGLINVYTELEGYDPAKARARTAGIFQTIEQMLTLAQTNSITTFRASEIMAYNALNQQPQMA